MDFDYNYGYSYGYDPLGSNFENAVVTMLFSIYLIVLTAVLIFALVSYSARWAFIPLGNGWAGNIRGLRLSPLPGVISKVNLQAKLY